MKKSTLINILTLFMALGIMSALILLAITLAITLLQYSPILGVVIIAIIGVLPLFNYSATVADLKKGYNTTTAHMQPKIDAKMLELNKKYRDSNPL